MDRVIAIVGRPNVGKSALFNRLAGRRIAIVHDQPGVTRDRVSAVIDWGGKPLTLVDTGGIGLFAGEKSKDAVTGAALGQAEIAIESAQLIVLVVNIKEGILPLDLEVAKRLLQSGKPVLVAANKADDDRDAVAQTDFQPLGFSDIFPVSAIHGRGLDDFTSAIDFELKKLPAPSEEEESGKDKPARIDNRPIKLAFVGRPNVGKSSIVNAFAKSQRVIVSSIPGTTRDCVDVPFTIETEGEIEDYLLIDTAGIRKRRRVNDSIEFFSVKRSEDAINRADIVVHVFDAQAGVTLQDKKIADVIVEAKKACILVVNKWDLYDKMVKEARKTVQKKSKSTKERQHTDGQTYDLSMFGDWVQKQMFFLDYAPVIFTSAHNGFHMDRLLEAIRYVAGQLKQSIPTAVLNRTLHDAILKRQPSSKSGSRLKFFYATQIKLAPPSFLLFVNRKELFTDQYEKYLSREVRKAFGYEGCPVVLIPKSRPKSVDSIRRPRKPNTRKKEYYTPSTPVTKKGIKTAKSKLSRPRRGGPKSLRRKSSKSS
jgi:GTPase